MIQPRSPAANQNPSEFTGCDVQHIADVSLSTRRAAERLISELKNKYLQTPAQFGK